MPDILSKILESRNENITVVTIHFLFEMKFHTIFHFSVFLSSGNLYLVDKISFLGGEIYLEKTILIS